MDGFVDGKTGSFLRSPCYQRREKQYNTFPAVVGKGAKNLTPSVLYLT
jgi:hypothetical protein